MVVDTEEKICEMRLLISAKELAEFKKDFPEIKWQAGDTNIRWNANKPEEVEMAKKAFEAYKQKHPKAMAFRVNPQDKKETNQIKDFDPNAEMIIMQEFMQKG
jgi:hypothetical protein